MSFNSCSIHLVCSFETISNIYQRLLENSKQASKRTNSMVGDDRNNIMNLFKKKDKGQLTSVNERLLPITNSRGEILGMISYHGSPTINIQRGAPV